MRTLRLVLFLSALSGAIFASVETAAQFGAEYDRKRGINGRTELAFGGFLVGFDTTVRFGSPSLLGAIIDAEDVLGLDSGQDNYRFEGHYRFARKHRLEVGLINLDRTSTIAIAEEIELDPETTIKVGAIVDTKFKTAFLKTAYKYSFVNDGKVDAGFTVGLSFVDVDVGIKGVGLVELDGVPQVGEVSEDASAAAPVPVFGSFMNLTLRPRLFYVSGLELFRFKAGSWEGSLVDVRLGLSWYFTKHLGASVGFNYLRIEYDRTRSSGQSYQVDYEFYGTLFMLNGVF